MNKRKSQLFALISLFALLACVFLLLLKKTPGDVLAQASYQTPTPNAEGRILYTVQEGDTCTRVFLLTGVEINQIIALNGLDADCAISSGNQLLLGIVEAPALTQTAMPTTMPIDITPSPTPSPGYAELCIVLFDDIDGTGMRIESEPYLAGGEVSINNRSGTVSLTGTTVGGDPELVDPLCFLEVPEGDYNISVAIPDGYNATTNTNYALTLKAGDNAVLDFGAQTNANISAIDDVSGGGRSPLLGIAGLVLLLGGLGLGFYMWRTRQS